MPARRDSGFSLVEVMAAMFIAALAAAAVVFALPEPVPDEIEAADRLAASLTRAQRAAVVRGAPVGLTVSTAGYGYAVWREGEWRALDADSGLGPADWPRGVLASVETETSAAAEPPENFPAVIFDQTGGATPFSVTLTGARGNAAVSGSASGEIAVHANG